MINGLYLSEIDTIGQAQKSHYRNLNKIINSPTPGFTKQEHSIMDIIDKRRHFHQRWKRFKTTQKQLNVSRENRKIGDRIQQILMRGSRYHFNPNKESMKVTRAHQFYRRKRMEELVDRQNPQIARRIIKAHGSIDLNKSNESFKESRRILHRMERYPVAKRMMEFSEKKLRETTRASEKVKTEGVERRPWRM